MLHLPCTAHGACDSGKIGFCRGRNGNLFEMATVTLEQNGFPKSSTTDIEGNNVKDLQRKTSKNYDEDKSIR